MTKKKKKEKFFQHPMLREFKRHRFPSRFRKSDCNYAMSALNISDGDVILMEVDMCAITRYFGFAPTHLMDGVNAVRESIRNRYPNSALIVMPTNDSIRAIPVQYRNVIIDDYIKYLTSLKN